MGKQISTAITFQFIRNWIPIMISIIALMITVAGFLVRIEVRLSRIEQNLENEQRYQQEIHSVTVQKDSEQDKLLSEHGNDITRLKTWTGL